MEQYTLSKKNKVNEQIVLKVRIDYSHQQFASVASCYLISKFNELWIIEFVTAFLETKVEANETGAVMTHNGNASSSSGNTPTSIATGNVEERLMVCKRSSMKIYSDSFFMLEVIIWNGNFPCSFVRNFSK